MAVEKVQGITALPMRSAGRVGRQGSSSPAVGSGEPVQDVVTLSGQAHAPSTTEPPPQDRVLQAAEEVPQIRSCQLRFAIHENPDCIVVRVLDAETGKQIGQIPPEELLRVAAQMELLRSE